MRTILIIAVTCCFLTPVQAGDGKQLVRTFKGHTKEVTDVAFSPDSKRLASSSHDATVRIWDTATGKELHTLEKAHRFIAECVAFSPDGKWLASGGWDATVRLWGPATGRKVRTLQASSFEDDTVSSVAFSPDSKKLMAVGELVAAGFNEPILIWDVGSGKLERKLDSKITNGLFSVAFNHDGKVFATASFHSGIRIWDAANGRVAKALRWDQDGMMDAVSHIVFSRDGKRLVSLDLQEEKTLHLLKETNAVPSPKLGKGTVKVWDVARGNELMTLRGHKSHVQCVAISPDGKRIVSGGWDGTVNVLGYALDPHASPPRSFRRHRSTDRRQRRL